MRCDSAASAKGTRRGACRLDVPSAGTATRAVYDLFQSNKGTPIDFVVTNRNQPLKARLIDCYGLDIRRVGKSRWVLAGEWFGRVYVDYIAERMEGQK